MNESELWEMLSAAQSQEESDVLWEWLLEVQLQEESEAE